jgi:hypothetical protein
MENPQYLAMPTQIVETHRLYTTEDLRLGTFGDPLKFSLCVFGEDLLAVVEHDLTALLGTVLRRGGQNVGNTWTFGPSR